VAPSWQHGGQTAPVGVAGRSRRSSCRGRVLILRELLTVWPQKARSSLSPQELRLSMAVTAGIGKPRAVMKVKHARFPQSQPRET